MKILDTLLMACNGGHLIRNTRDSSEKCKIRVEHRWDESFRRHEKYS
uniref:Uncharacterized protein n=1 Tax=Arundo donax TaxID=35708 RepID=A0A0A9A5P0_ARUDO